MLHAIIYVAITYPAIGYYWSAYKVFWYFYATLCTFLYFVYLGMFLVSVCPGVEIASVLSTAIYTILNLFSGFLLPGPVPSKSLSFFFLHFMSMHIQGRAINVEFFSYTQKIPKWWIWCYWICPTSWSLNGLLTSQYGDMNREILIFGEHKTVGSFLHDYYGFHHDRLGLVAAVLIAFPVAFAILFAYCIGKLNYQRT